MTDAELFAELAKPFPEDQVEWRIGRSGVNSKGAWAVALCYITNRGIMDRLDAVFGPANWWNEFKPHPCCDGVLCGLSIRLDHVVTKWDGASIPKDIRSAEMDAGKAALSNAMKRCAVQWGIGRYLYDLPETPVKCVGADADRHKFPHYASAKKPDGERVPFRWANPQLPAWAKPVEDWNKLIERSKVRLSNHVESRDSAGIIAVIDWWKKSEAGGGRVKMVQNHLAAYLSEHLPPTGDSAQFISALSTKGAIDESVGLKLVESIGEKMQPA